MIIRHLQKNWVQVLLLQLAALLIYYPVFYSNYLYTDEAVQLWNYRPGSGYHMFTEQGRYLTDVLMSSLFGRADTISDVRYLRIFSFAGWLVCIPIWFLVLKNVLAEAGLRNPLAFLITLWLIGSPSFGISIGWASTMELFIANTAGLLGGYGIYLLLVRNELPVSKNLLMLLSFAAGLVSLFTYQNGFGCFLLPFFLYTLLHPGRYRVAIRGLMFFAAIALVYFLLFRYQMQVMNIEGSGRTGIRFSPVKKIVFFFTKALPPAFFGNLVYTESDRTALFYFTPFFLLMLFGTFRWFPVRIAGGVIATGPGADAPVIRARPSIAIGLTLQHLLVLLLLLMLMYFPSLLVKENYASARTRLVLTVAVATWAVVLLSRWRAGGLLAGAPFLFLVFWLVAMGRSNYNKGFRKPLEAEYAAARKLFDSTYDRTTNSFVFHAPSEDQFAIQYDRQRSWDEYSVPSLFFPWVPEPFFKQLLYERTGDRRLADSLQVSVLPGPPAYNRR